MCQSCHLRGKGCGGCPTRKRGECALVDRRGEGGRHDVCAFLSKQHGQEHAGKRQAAQGQAAPEPVSCPRQPAREGAFSPAQDLGRFGIGLAFEVAEHHGSLVFSRQSSDLLIEHRSQLLPEGIRRRIRGRHFWNLPFAAAPPGGDSSCPPGHAIGDAIEPVSQRRRIAQRPGLLQKDQERRLESVVRRMAVLEETPANTQYHGAVPFQKRGEGSLVFAADKTIQELRVGDIFGGPNRRQRRNRPSRQTGASTWHLAESSRF